LRKTSLGATAEGSPIYLRDVADIRIGPDIRRGIAEWNGEGETVGAIVIMRYGENARDTIGRVKKKLAELEQGLPPGVSVEVGYDRSDLIKRATETLTGTLMEEMLVVSLVMLLFLLHARSALVAAFVLPTGVLASLGVMYLFGINANIMSLGGIAIAVGVMVDSSVIMVENAHKHLEREKHRVSEEHEPRSRSAVITEAAIEVGPSLFFSLLIITVSFVPVFALGEQSGRLFRPLAYTKTFSMGMAAIIAVTIIPVLMVYLLTERVVSKSISRWKRWSLYAVVIAVPAVALALIPLPNLDEYRWWLVGGWIVLSSTCILPQSILSEERNPISGLLERVYDPLFAMAMHFRWLALLLAIGVVAVTYWPLSQLGSEFMPPLEEGDLLYMPTTIEPGLSVTKAKELLQQTDKLLMQFPEVKNVLGKIGRAETATDPAPLNMVETIVTLHRDKSHWRQVPTERFYSSWPGWMQWLPNQVFAEFRPITSNELIYGFKLPDGKSFQGMNEALQIPGLANSWTMPIKTRIDMLSTGIKTPVGIKVMGPDLPTLSKLSNQIAQLVQTAEGTGTYTTSAFAEKSVGGNYLDIKIDRDEIARYGLRIAQVQDVIMTALGGMKVTSTVEGLERYPVNLRYPAELRDSIPALEQTLVATPSGAQVPLAQLAHIETIQGPPMIKSENARLTSWVFVDIAGIDVGTYVTNAQKVVADAVELPQGYNIVWSGQFEYMQQARQRLSIMIPLTGLIIVVLLYMATGSWLRVGIVLLAIPFSLVGAIWFLYFLDYDFSLAVGVGLIALAGLDAETGLVMLLYLDNSFERFRDEGRMRNKDDLWYAIHDGAVKRIRPKTMTVVTTFTGLVPLMWATGAGADTMRRLAAPMIGGLATSFLMELLIYPIIFFIAKHIAMRHVFEHSEELKANPKLILPNT
ncbi:MAG: efflux RND transporter permease subunit, partial [Aureliella sp.]